DVAGVSHRIGVRDLATHADAILDRVLAGESTDRILEALAGTTIRDGYRARPLAPADVETIARFVDDVRRRVATLGTQADAMRARCDRITALLQPTSQEPA